MATEDIDPEDLSTNIVNLGVELEDAGRFSRKASFELLAYMNRLDLRLISLNKQIAQLQNLAWETAKTRERLKQARHILFQINPDTQNPNTKEN